MMEVLLEKATESDAQSIFDIQVKSFMPLLQKYQDYETNPANETIEKVIRRINRSNGGFYKILENNILVGAICIYWKENSQFCISPMFIHPAFQGNGIAQKAITIIEKMFPQAQSWELDTLLEEERNCHLYEKMGYSQTGDKKKLNEYATLVFYKKVLKD